MKNFNLGVLVMFLIFVLISLAAAQPSMTLIEAVKNNDSVLVKKIITKNKVNDIDERSMTALHWASGNGNVEMVKILIDNGANVNAQEKSGYTPLHFAAGKGFNDVISVLVKSGADINKPAADNSTPLHFSAECDQTGSVNLLVKLSANVNAQESSGKRVLHIISKSKSDSTETVFLLIKAGADVNALDTEENTALHYSLAAKSGPNSKMLLASGADVKIKNKKKETSLHAGASLIDAGVSKMLLNSEIMNSKDESGITPLQTAAEYNNMDILKPLLALGADPNLADNTGKTPLHKAAKKGNKEILKELLDFKADLEAKDNSGFTALHFAASNDEADSLGFLLKSGIKNINLKDSLGRTALMIAVMKNSEGALRELIKSKADVNDGDNEGKMPLTVAKQNGYNGIVGLLIEAGAQDSEPYTKRFAKLPQKVKIVLYVFMIFPIFCLIVNIKHYIKSRQEAHVFSIAFWLVISVAWVITCVSSALFLQTMKLI